MLQNVCVLLVEDHDDTRETVARGLQQQGARVVAANSAQVGLLLVERERPHVMVVDLELPEIDGYAFLRAVRALPAEQGGKTPAVALTVHNQPEDRRKSLLRGFRLHLAKPVTTERLARVLAGLVELSAPA